MFRHCIYGSQERVRCKLHGPDRFRVRLCFQISLMLRWLHPRHGFQVSLLQRLPSRLLLPSFHSPSSLLQLSFSSFLFLPCSAFVSGAQFEERGVREERGERKKRTRKRKERTEGKTRKAGSEERDEQKERREGKL